MGREWKFEVAGAFVTAVVNNDDSGLSAVITGEIVDGPRVGDSDLPPRIVGNECYGPVTVRARSLGELKWAVEEKIEDDIGHVINCSDI